MNKAMSPTTATPARISRIIFFMRGSYSGSLQIVYAIAAAVVLNRCPDRHQNVAFLGIVPVGGRYLWVRRPTGQPTGRSALPIFGVTYIRRYQFADKSQAGQNQDRQAKSDRPDNRP